MPVNVPLSLDSQGSLWFARAGKLPQAFRLYFAWLWIATVLNLVRSLGFAFIAQDRILAVFSCLFALLLVIGIHKFRRRDPSAVPWMIALHSVNAIFALVIALVVEESFADKVLAPVNMFAALYVKYSKQIATELRMADPKSPWQEPTAF